jgi:predicted DNA-binding protein YlxM (UPF0122 family)
MKLDNKILQKAYFKDRVVNTIIHNEINVDVFLQIEKYYLTGLTCRDCSTVLFVSPRTIQRNIKSFNNLMNETTNKGINFMLLRYPNDTLKNYAELVKEYNNTKEKLIFFLNRYIFQKAQTIKSRLSYYEPMIIDLYYLKKKGIKEIAHLFDKSERVIQRNISDFHQALHEYYSNQAEQ